MTPRPSDDPLVARKRGLEIRGATLDLLCGAALGQVLGDLALGASSGRLDRALNKAMTSSVLSDLEQDEGWKEEQWLLEPSGDVRPATPGEFAQASPAARFSRSECLRRPKPQAWALRGFLSALVSPEARQSLSRSYGRAVTFRSAEIARYRDGHYLRRHSDIFDGRLFGFVWFFNPDPPAGAGGELIIEAESGEATVVAPEEGSLAAINFQPNCFHHVARIRGSDWTRYVIASHYALSEPV